MSKTSVILEIDTPHFNVRLYESLLKIDLKGSAKNEIVEALENKPILRETIGGILSIFAPLHVRLSDIDSVRMDKSGGVKLILPRHRDITIPLKVNEAKRLVDKLNQLIPKEKEKELERAIKRRETQKIEEEERGAEHAEVVSSVFPVAQPPGVLEKLKESEEEIEKEEQVERD